MKISQKKRKEEKSLVEALRTKKEPIKRGKRPLKFLPCHTMKLRPRPSVSGSFSKLPREMVENVLKLMTCRELAMVEACSSYFREQAREVWKKKANIAICEEVSNLKMGTDRFVEEGKKYIEQIQLPLPEMDDENLYIEALKQRGMELNQLCTEGAQLKLEDARVLKMIHHFEDGSWKEVLKTLA